MKAHPDRLFLIHRETGQRYAVRGEVTIGRAAGDIVFSRDPKMSHLHCRITPTPEGVMVFDLESANGTLIDGKRIRPNHGFKLAPDAKLTVGRQEFTLQVVSVAKLVKRSRARRRRKQSAPVLSYFMVLIFLAVAGSVFYVFLQRNSLRQVEDRQNDMVRELTQIVNEYDDLQNSLERQSAPPQEIATRIESRIVQSLRGLTNRMNAFTGGTPRQQKIFILQRDYAEAFSAKAHAYSLFLVNADLRFQEQMDAAEDQMTRISAEYASLGDPGQHTQAALPVELRSPQRIVEKEMRQALHDYQTLGQAVRDQKVSERQMAERIRTKLLPKMQAVFTRMGAIEPDSPPAQKRMVLEQKLVSAFIGQLKAVALFGETKDGKYNAEANRWATLIEKINADVKEANTRKPAGTNYAPTP